MYPDRETAAAIWAARRVVLGQLQETVDLPTIRLPDSCFWLSNRPSPSTVPPSCKPDRMADTTCDCEGVVAS